jgi:hypothetical protein
MTRTSTSHAHALTTRTRRPRPIGDTLTRRHKRQVDDLVLRLTTHADMTLTAANIMLQALGISPLRGNRRVGFRVPVAIDTDIDPSRPGRAIDEANRYTQWVVKDMTWTRFGGCPDGYGIDPPTTDPDTGQHILVVHTDLYLDVTVPAYRPGELVKTAYALLAQDFLETPLDLDTRRISHVSPHPKLHIDEEDEHVDVSAWNLGDAALCLDPVDDRESP